jgi:hypothetical protein
MNLLVSQYQHILHYLVKHVPAQEPSRLDADFILGDCLTELMRLQMRDVADRPTAVDDIWNDALTTVKSDLEGMLPGIGADLVTRYEDSLQSELKPVLREMNSQRIALLAARDREFVLPREQFTEGVPVPFEIVWIGTRHNPQRILAMPLDRQTCDFNRAAIRNIVTFDEKWFPYELQVEGMTFILDDDGSLSIDIANLPRTMIDKAYEQLQFLATRIYQKTDVLPYEPWS